VSFIGKMPMPQLGSFTKRFDTGAAVYDRRSNGNNSTLIERVCV